MEKYYKILEVQTHASEQDIKQAYRELVKVWHPDRFAHDIKLQKRAEDKLKEINDAYERIVVHLNNSQKRQQAQQNQNRNTQETSSQPPPKQPHNSWICPQCFKSNYIYHLSCGCGFRTNEAEITTYKADKTASDLYDAIHFNRSMGYSERAAFLSRYLQKRFPYSAEAEKSKENPTPPPKQKKSIFRRLYERFCIGDIYVREQRRAKEQRKFQENYTKYNRQYGTNSNKSGKSKSTDITTKHR